MTTLQSPALFQQLWKAKLASGLTALALGVAVLVWPGPSILVAAVLFGLFLVLSGIVELVFALTLDVSVPHRILLFVSGALSVILGVLAFRHFGQGYAVLLLAIWIGVGFIFQGVSETTLGISVRQIPGRGWLVFGGVIAIMAGVVVLAWPFSSIVVLALVTGIWLVIIGIARIVSAFRTRKAANTVERGFERFAGPSGSRGR
ncbi:MAG TPA: HdeD family acid-resistance protein [Mycobacterium sp.]|nr:HdeD family acid-resistance protein [Mycobacterium sp.]